MTLRIANLLGLGVGVFFSLALLMEIAVPSVTFKDLPPGAQKVFLITFFLLLLASACSALCSIFVHIFADEMEATE